MLQYYEELRPTVEELVEWNARLTNWEVLPGAARECTVASVFVSIPGTDLYDHADDWMPLSDLWNSQDSQNLVNFLSFDSSASASLSGLENPADFEYRAPEAFA